MTLDDINAFFEKKNKNKRVHTCNVQLNANYEHSELETWKGKEVYKVHKHGKQLDTGCLWWIGMRSYLLCLVCCKVLLFIQLASH